MGLLRSIIIPILNSLKDQVCHRILPSLHLLDLDDLLTHSIGQKQTETAMVIMMYLVMGETRADRQVEEVVY